MAIGDISSRLGTPTNLPQGATYDLLIMSFPDGFPEGKVLFNIDSTPRKVTGIQKAAQVFMKVLLTTYGSDVYHPTHGTQFSNLTMHANKVTSDPLLLTQLQGEIQSATSQSQVILNSSTSDAASQIKSVMLLGSDVGQESLVLYMELTTMAGQQAAIAVPFPQTDMFLSPGA